MYMPKRVVELSPFNSDSEDDINDVNKSNSFKTVICTKKPATDKNSWNCVQPKRVSEILLDSDSDTFEEKELEFYNSNENRNEINSSLNIDELSNKLKLVEISLENTVTPKFPIPKSSSSKSKILTDKNEYRKSPLIFNKIASKQCTSSDSSPRPKILPEKLFDVHRTPFKTPNAILNDGFVTPQIPSISKSKYKKSRASLENEFQSQKILFTTPKSAVRPLSCASIENNCSLDDTLKDFSSLEKHEKPLLIEEKKNNKLLEINGKTYVLEKKIGSGGSSTVFLATDINSSKEFAIKIVNLQGDPSVTEGYINESKLLRKLQGDISVVILFDFAHIPSEYLLYMVMEKGDSDLHKILQSYKESIPLYNLINYWYQILKSVDYIHKNGIIHSDLKPANFLMIKGRLKLIDFGIASNISQESTSIIKTSQAGTFNYISPEALTDISMDNTVTESQQPAIKISTKSDVWSLGCIFYLFIYGKTPFAHIKNMYAKVHAITNPDNKIEYLPLPNYYPSMLLEMVQRCLQQDPKKRASVAELLKFPFHMLIPLDEAHNQK